MRATKALSPSVDGAESKKQSKITFGLLSRFVNSQKNRIFTAVFFCGQRLVCYCTLSALVYLYDLAARVWHPDTSAFFVQRLLRRHITLCVVVSTAMRASATPQTISPKPASHIGNRTHTLKNIRAHQPLKTTALHRIVYGGTRSHSTAEQSNQCSACLTYAARAAKSDPRLMCAGTSGHAGSPHKRHSIKQHTATDALSTFGWVANADADALCWICTPPSQWHVLLIVFASISVTRMVSCMLAERIPCSLNWFINYRCDDRSYHESSRFWMVFVERISLEIQLIC